MAAKLPSPFHKKSKIIFNTRKSKIFLTGGENPCLKLAKNADFAIGYYPDRYVLSTYERRGAVIKLIVLKLI